MINHSVRDLPLSDAREATAGWLTRVLAREHLRGGEVSEVAREVESSCNATISCLRLTYTPGSVWAGGAAPPERLLLKIVASGHPFTDGEVAYYSTVTRDIRPSPAPDCFHVAHCPSTGHYHLLLEDLTGTHLTGHSAPPERDRARLVVDALARLHAHWCDRADLASIGSLPSGAVIERYVAVARNGLEPMLSDAGSRLSPGQVHLIRRVFDRHPALLTRRAAEASHLTCIHGDPNPGNLLLPREPGDGRAYLIDRQPFDWSLTVWTGASDLAYLMVHWWPTRCRRSLQAGLLECYHQRLMELGVRGYPLTALQFDYRLAAMQSLYVVAARCSDPEERTTCAWVWKPQLRKTLAALEDLDCAALLE